VDERNAPAIQHARLARARETVRRKHRARILEVLALLDEDARRVREARGHAADEDAGLDVLRHHDGQLEAFELARRRIGALISCPRARVVEGTGGNR